MEDLYLGKVNNLITMQDINNICGLNNIGKDTIEGAIQWLHILNSDNTELYIADRNIKVNISYDELQKAGVVEFIYKGYYKNQGKIIVINDYMYRLRLLTGGDENPYYSRGGEWDRYIVKFTPNNIDSNWTDAYSWVQEGTDFGVNTRAVRGYRNVKHIKAINSREKSNILGFRPVLEKIR